MHLPLRFLVVALGTLSPLAAQVRPYRAIDLGQVPGQHPAAGVSAGGISSDGRHVAGWSVWEPYVWDDGSGMRALAKPVGQRVVSALAVNSGGIAVGKASTGQPHLRALLWDASSAVTMLHRSAWVWSIAEDINDAGTILLTAALPNGTQNGRRHVFLGTRTSGFVDLAPTTRIESYGIDLNERGQAVVKIDGYYRRWSPGGALTSLSPYRPWCLNELGQVAGSNGGMVARFDDASGWVPLPNSQLAFDQVGGIDDFGQIVATHRVRVGQSPPSYAYFGYLWTDGLGWRRLEDLVDVAQQVDVEHVAGITAGGRIAVQGSIGPDNRALILEPRFVHVSGVGCAGSGGIAPRATVAGIPQGGQRIALLATGGRPGGQGAFLFATRSIATSIAGCTLLVDPAGIVDAPVRMNASGQVSVPLTLPPGVGATSVWMQFVSLDGGAANGAFALSNAVRVDLQ